MAKDICSFDLKLFIKQSLSADALYITNLNDYCNDKKITVTDFLNKIYNSKLKKEGYKDFKDLLKKEGVYKRILKEIDMALSKVGIMNKSQFLINESYKRWEYEGFT